jgi:hypothetical protein
MAGPNTGGVAWIPRHDNIKSCLIKVVWWMYDRRLYAVDSDAPCEASGMSNEVSEDGPTKKLHPPSVALS